MTLRLDDLTPLRQLGHGTLCEVLLVEDRSGRRYALKRPLADRRSPGVLRLLQDEGRVAAQLRHERIPRLLAAFDDALLFEVLDGTTLDEVVPKKTAVPQAEAVFVVLQLLEALDYVHALPAAIVHRDVGPHNVMITRSGDVALIDFGIALNEERERWTATGALRGALGYLSPEAVRGEAVDARADLFGAAALLYRLLLGSSPFGGRGPRGILAAVALGRFAPVADASLQALFSRGLGPDPAQRFQSAAELSGAVRGLGSVELLGARRAWAFRVAPLLLEGSARAPTLS